MENKKNKLTSILRWVFGIIALIISTVNMIENNYLSATLILFSGLLMLPFTSHWLELKLNFWKKRWVRILFPILLLLVGSICSTNKKKKSLNIEQLHRFTAKNYISNNQSHSIESIRLLIQGQRFLGEHNNALANLSSKYLNLVFDSLNIQSEINFNPKINFDVIYNNGILEEGYNNKRIKNYVVNFVIDSSTTIKHFHTTLTYQDLTTEIFTDSVYTIMTQFNKKNFDLKKSEYEVRIQAEEEKLRLAEKLSNWDNSDFWNEFDPLVKERIYSLVTTKKCSELQAEFNIASNNYDKNGKSKFYGLMGFIDEKMEHLGCY